MMMAAIDGKLTAEEEGFIYRTASVMQISLDIDRLHRMVEEYSKEIQQSDEHGRLYKLKQSLSSTGEAAHRTGRHFIWRLFRGIDENQEIR